MSSPARQTRYLEANHNGDTIRVPVTETRGSDGPTLAIVGGVHGAEYAGIEAVRRISAELDPAALHGRVLTVPCLNVPAFYGFAAHVNPVDGENPARAFPGSASGSYTERMVHLVWSELLVGADYIIDVHGGDLEEELVDYSQINLNGDPAHDTAAEKLARALDMPFFVLRAAPPEPVTSEGTICQIASAHGIPAVLAEAGSHADLDEESVEAHLHGMRNVLRHLKMISGEPQIYHPEPLVMHGFAGVAAPVDGAWYPRVSKGDVLTKGEAVGEMRDFFGVPVATVFSEVNAAVLGVMTTPPRRRGEMLLGLGTFD